MESIAHMSVEHKSERKGDPAVRRARRAIRRFARSQLEYLLIRQQFEHDLMDCAGCPEARRRVCQAYSWLAKGA